MKKRIITIAREKGSGGHYVGELLAEKLGIHCYDQRLLVETTQKSGFSQEFIEKYEERNPTIFRTPFSIGISTSEYSHPLHQQVFEAQSKVIREIADREPCVFVGRCADYILRDREDVVNCFIHAPVAKRIERIMEREQISAAAAEKLLYQTDKSRTSYYSFFADRTWGSVQNYHISVDTSITAISGAVEVILSLLAVTEKKTG